jgi:hypothetical protein
MRNAVGMTFNLKVPFNHGSDQVDVSPSYTFILNNNLMTGMARYQITSQHNDDTMTVNKVKDSLI